MRGESVLKVRGLVSGYGDVEVLREVDLDIGSGEVVALLGPNGAGKTTLLLTIAGLLPIRRGQIHRGDDDAQYAPHRIARNGTILVPERNIFTQLTVEENLRLGRGEPDETYDIFPTLRPLARRRAGLLSGGEQQMLSVGRALAGQPKLLLIDELSLGLAPMIVSDLLAMVRAAADRGTSVLLVEQHISRALAVADRGYVLSRGQVVSSGTAEELHAGRLQLADAYLS